MVSIALYDSSLLQNPNERTYYLKIADDVRTKIANSRCTRSIVAFNGWSVGSHLDYKVDKIIAEERRVWIGARRRWFRATPSQANEIKQALFDTLLKLAYSRIERLFVSSKPMDISDVEIAQDQSAWTPFTIHQEGSNLFWCRDFEQENVRIQFEVFNYSLLTVSSDDDYFCVHIYANTPKLLYAPICYIEKVKRAIEAAYANAVKKEQDRIKQEEEEKLKAFQKSDEFKLQMLGEPIKTLYIGKEKKQEVKEKNSSTEALGLETTQH